MAEVLTLQPDISQDVLGSGFLFHRGNVLDCYGHWPSPDVIISDGAYGVRGFEGDTASPGELVDWYRPHVQAWSRAARPSTCLWFWNTEVGWATVHPLLESMGWEYVQTVIWDKGLAHIAGNVNGKTIRQLPVVSEVSVLYRRRVMLPTEDGRALCAKDWLRHEWERSGLPLYLANEACGVKNAASRKYLTRDWLWYWPPGIMVERMARYCALHGKATLRPYFTLDGRSLPHADEWDSLRSPWSHENGVTNVWSRPPLGNDERIRVGHGGNKAAHLNQKPVEFMERQIRLCSREGDVVWEPFGGLVSASVAAIRLGRRAFAAESNDRYQEIALGRLYKEEELARRRREFA